VSNPNHPIWGLARTIVIMIGVTGILAVTASKFDESELKTILMLLPVVIGSETIGAFFRGKKEDAK